MIYFHLKYLFATSPGSLLGHVERLMTGWYQEMLGDADEWMRILEKDGQETRKLSN